jgi:hypothetical protein
MLFLNVGKLWEIVPTSTISISTGYSCVVRSSGDGTLVISVGVHVVASCSDSHWMKMMKAATGKWGTQIHGCDGKQYEKTHEKSWLVVWNHGNFMTFHWEYSSQLTNSYFSEG